MILNSILISEYSAFWIIPIVLLSFGLSYFLYRNDKYLQKLNKLPKFGLIAIRFLSIFLISFFLIKPLIVNLKQQLFKPQLIILQDNSQSIVLNKDSLYYQNELPKQYQEFYKQLRNSGIEYATYSFSDSIRLNSKFNFNRKITDISNALNEASNLNLENNIGGILLLTDGIYNKGRDPFYTSKNIHIPVYTVNLGDSTSTSDLRIQSIEINKIGFTEQTIPFSINISAENAKNKVAKLTISENETNLFEQSIDISKSSFYQSIENHIANLDVGLHTLVFELSPLENEYNTKNNKQIVYINIIESKQKILLLSASPHPDISAIKSVLLKQNQFEVESYNIEKFNAKIKSYNLVILHQLPTKRHSLKAIIDDLKKHHIPTLNIISPQTNIKQLNTLNSNIVWASALKKNEWLELKTNTAFSLFNIDKQLIQFIDHLPPIVAPMLKYKLEGESHTFAFQKIKGIETNKPAIIFTETETNKLGFILGEGLWKWKLYNYQQEGNIQLFSDLLVKMVQYLSVKTPKDAFIIDIKNQFEEYENVRANIQLYNRSFELMQNQEIEFTYTNKDGHEFKHVPNPTNAGYSVDLGRLDAGEYTYRISTLLEGKEIDKSGTFVVIPSILEHRQLTANHQLLKSISDNTNAINFNRDNWLHLADSIKESPRFKPQVYSFEKLTDLIHIKWIFFVISILLFLEWLIRKYQGTI